MSGPVSGAPGAASATASAKLRQVARYDEYALPGTPEMSS